MSPVKKCNSKDKVYQQDKASERLVNMNNSLNHKSLHDRECPQSLFRTAATPRLHFCPKKKETMPKITLN